MLTNDEGATPVELELPGPVAMMSNEFGTFCVLLRSGEVYCADSIIGFTEVPEARGAEVIRHNCAFLPDGRTYCWGRDVTEAWGAEAADGGFVPLSGIVDALAEERSVGLIAIRNDGSVWFSYRATNPLAEVAKPPCDLTEEPRFKPERILARDVRGLLLADARGIVADTEIGPCELLQVDDCPDSDAEWGLFGAQGRRNGAEDDIVFRSDVERLCEWFGACEHERDSLCGTP